MTGSVPRSLNLLRQMRYLIALEERRHFPQSQREVCGIRNPRCTVQIKTLEERFGVTLVERGRGPVRLTLAA